MKYTVTWRPGAERRLAQLWIDEPNRHTIADAADALDRKLAIDPQHLGESRLDTTRVVFEGRLVELFDVNEADRMVSVLDIWRTSRA